MPGIGPMPAPNCNAPVTWSGAETENADAINNALAAFTAAYTAASKAADKLMKTFEAQGCPAGCTFQSSVRADPVITVLKPIVRQAVKNKGMRWVCDLTWTWSDTIYCYKTAKAKKDAEEEREKEEREKEKKAKKDG